MRWKDLGTKESIKIIADKDLLKHRDLRKKSVMR